MGLLKDIEASDKKGLFHSDDTYVNYMTGILPLDYANGFWQEVKLADGTSTFVPILGIIGGTFVSIIGDTGSGKSTLADQIAFNIIKDFEDGLMTHIDAERTALRQRILRICGVETDDERIKLKKENIAIEDVLSMFDQVCAAKEAGGTAYKYEVTNKTLDGRKFMAYIPTVFIIDSLPSFNSSEYNTEDLGTNMDQARASKDISRFVNNTIGRALKYNITFLVINHIRPKIVTDRFAAPPPGIMMLKPTETLVRGAVMQFMTQNYFRINMIKSNMYIREDMGFEGFKASIQVAKSKTNFVGASVDVAFNKDIGFDPIFSLYEFASSLGLLQGKNPNLYIQGLDTFKFNRKDFRRRYIEDKTFRDAFMSILKPYFESLLGEKTIAAESRVRYGDLMDMDGISDFDYGEEGMPEINTSIITSKQKRKPK